MSDVGWDRPIAELPGRGVPKTPFPDSYVRPWGSARREGLSPFPVLRNSKPLQSARSVLQLGGLFLRVVYPCPLDCSAGTLAPRTPLCPATLLPMPPNSDAGMTPRGFRGPRQKVGGSSHP